MFNINIKTIINVSICSFLLLFMVSISPILNIKIVRANTLSSSDKKVLSLIANKKFNQNSAVVVYKNQTSKIATPQINVNKNISIIKKPNNENYSSFLKNLITNNKIKSVSPNYVRSFSSLPNNVNISEQKNLFMINAPVVNNTGFTPSLGGSSNITVAVLDSGVAYQNFTNSLTGITYGEAPSLSYLHIVDPYNALAVYNNQTVNEYSPYDGVGHGTYVTGVIASATNQDSSGSPLYGTAGIAFNTTIMPIKIGNSSGIPLSAEILGLQWAIAHHANVINLSIEGTTPSSAEETEIEDAINAGIVVVASSGNEGNSSIDYPSGYPNVISVGASNSQNQLTSYSNYGCSTYNNCITLVAPVGYSNPLVYQQTYTGYNNGSISSYTSFSNEYLAGTSFSAPQVSAAVALYESAYGTQNAGNMINVIKQSSTNLGNVTKFGYGLLNVNALLTQSSPNDKYQIFSNTGNVYSFGGAQNYGNLSLVDTNGSPPVSISTVPGGYYILTKDGAVYTFGNAQFFGSMYNIPGNKGIPVTIASLPNDSGYYILTQNGAVYTFGNAQFYGSMYNIPSSNSISRTAINLSITNNGYYIVTQDGAVYTFGNAQFFGSMYNIPNAPSKTIVSFLPVSNGYYVLTSDGAVYTFGNAQFLGSMYNILNQPDYTPSGFLAINGGYYILTQNGAVYTFGDATFNGSEYGQGIIPLGIIN